MSLSKAYLSHIERHISLMRLKVDALIKVLAGLHDPLGAEGDLYRIDVTECLLVISYYEKCLAEPDISNSDYKRIVEWQTLLKDKIESTKAIMGTDLSAEECGFYGSTLELDLALFAYNQSCLESHAP